MIPEADGKSESKMDPDELARLLDIELAQKRAAWAEAGQRSRRIRTISFLFLAIVVLGALAAFVMVFTQLPQDRVKQTDRAQPVSSASP